MSGIPNGTLAKVRMTIRPGGFDDPNQGWTGGYASHSPTTGACYLDCEFMALAGPFAHRKVWSLVGLYSPKGDNYGQMGRALIRNILNSARGISHKDNSPAAQAARQIGGFHDLDGIEFVAKIEVVNGDRGEKNRIQKAITPDHTDYAAIMGSGGGNTGGGFTPPAAPAPANASRPAAISNRPSWAE